MISVIIPVYNCEKYIIDAIESVKQQSYKDYEIIVVDDGSTDGTLKLIRGITDITLICKLNGGPASALNAGIKEAGGEWIKWLSADDMLTPYALQILIDHAIYKDAIYYTDYIRYDVRKESKTFWQEPKRNELTQHERNEELFKYFYGNGSTSLIHRSVFDKCGWFDESLPHSEDYEFWLRCCILYDIKMIHIPEFTLIYRIHPDQLTNKVGGRLDNQIRVSITERLNAKT